MNCYEPSLTDEHIHSPHTSRPAQNGEGTSGPERQFIGISMSNKPGYLHIFPLIGFALGYVVASLFVDAKPYQGEWAKEAASVMYISLFVATAWAFSIIGRRSKRLRLWATDTVVGVSLMAFTYSLVIFLAVEVFMLVPVSGLLQLVLTLPFVALGTYAFFEWSSNGS